MPLPSGINETNPPDDSAAGELLAMVHHDLPTPRPSTAFPAGYDWRLMTAADIPV